MVWSYSGNPALSAKDRVRYLIGDVDSDDQKQTDEEIAWLLTQSPSVYDAASIACEAIAAKYANLMDKTVGSLSIRYSQKHTQYLTLSAVLLARQNSRASSGAKPFYGNKGATNPNEGGVIHLDGMTNPGYRVDARNDPRGV